MKIIVKEANKEKIEKLLNEIQSKARVRKCEYSDVERMVKEEKRLVTEQYRAHIKDLEGLKVWYNPWAEDYPKAYMYDAMATAFEIEYGKNGVAYLINYDRRKANYEKLRREVIDMPEGLKNAIVNAYKEK